MILNGSVGSFHFASIAASRSLTVWACAAPASGNSATSAMTSFFIGPSVFFVVSSHRVGAYRCEPALTANCVNKNAVRLSAAGIRYVRRERRIDLRRVVAGDCLDLEIL